MKPGDLVMVVRGEPCCSSTKELGRIFTVEGLKHLPADEVARCTACKTVYDVPTGTLFIIGDGEGWFPSQLIKINPPSSMKDEETRKELTA